MPETFADFWRMVWEQRSATIVMLTKLEERARIKCDQVKKNALSFLFTFHRRALHWTKTGCMWRKNIQLVLLKSFCSKIEIFMIS